MSAHHFTLHRLLAIVIKEFIQMRRDRDATLGLPRLTRATALRNGRLSLFLRADGDGGDALFSVFDAPTDAGAAAARVQETLRDLARRS